MSDHKGKGKGKARHIMVVNDTEEILELFQQILHEEAGYEVTLTSYRPQMIEFVKEIKPHLIISDHIFGHEQVGWQFVQALKMDRETMNIPIIVCSGAINELRGNEGYLVSKNVGVLYKPFDVDELLHLVATKLELQDNPEVHVQETHLSSSKSKRNGDGK
ncbi:MAG TPA: response regulator [Chloroflexia bacterium]|jgi:CheY-like chemotaxis protein